MPNHLIRRTSSIHPAQLDRRERYQLAKMETSAALTHRELHLRRELAQAQIIADTAVAHTAMASVAGTAGCVAALRDVSPEVAEALAFLQAKHVANVAQRMDDFSWTK
jgi:hypothetical protein